eukprot:gene9977-biopygen16761
MLGDRVQRGVRVPGARGDAFPPFLAHQAVQRRTGGVCAGICATTTGYSRDNVWNRDFMGIGSTPRPPDLKTHLSDGRTVTGSPLPLPCLPLPCLPLPCGRLHAAAHRPQKNAHGRRRRGRAGRRLRRGGGGGGARGNRATRPPRPGESPPSWG